MDEKERKIKEAAEDLIDKITRLWDVDKSLAPPVRFASLEDVDYLNFYPEEFPAPVYFHAPLYFDAFGKLDYEELMRRLTRACFRNVNPQIEHHFENMVRIKTLFDSADSGLLLAQKKLREENLDSLSDSEKEKIEESEESTRTYIWMVAKYSMLCLNDHLDNPIDLRESTSSVMANIRDSYPGSQHLAWQQLFLIMRDQIGKLLHGPDFPHEATGIDQELMNSRLVAWQQLFLKIKGYLGELIAERLYDTRGPGLLPELVRKNPDEAELFIRTVTNSGEIDLVKEIKEYYMRVQESRAKPKEE